MLAGKISAALLRGVSIGFCSDFPVEGELPGELYRAEKWEIAAGQEALSIAVALSDAEQGGSCLRPFRAASLSESGADGELPLRRCGRPFSSF